MAGHSKWANIKHRKMRSDQQKGKIFSRIAKEIITAVKLGGADPKSNAQLRLAIQKAKDANMPSENVQRNIHKASDTSQNYFYQTYELYGHGGVGILVDVVTDNKNRISSDMRIATHKRGGTIATPGAVAFNFDKKGIIQVPLTENQDSLFELVVASGAEDLISEEHTYLIITDPTKLYSIKESLEHQVTITDTSIEMIPKNWITCSDEDKEANEALLQYLDDLEDVQALYHNMAS